MKKCGSFRPFDNSFKLTYIFPRSFWWDEFHNVGDNPWDMESHEQGDSCDGDVPILGILLSSKLKSGCAFTIAQVDDNIDNSQLMCLQRDENFHFDKTSFTEK